MISGLEDICECFKSLIKNRAVGFFSMPNGVLCMPTILCTELRFNNCPCCGTRVRDIETTKDIVIQIWNSQKREIK